MSTHNCNLQFLIRLQKNHFHRIDSYYLTVKSRVIIAIVSPNSIDSKVPTKYIPLSLESMALEKRATAFAPRTHPTIPNCPDSTITTNRSNRSKIPIQIEIRFDLYRNTSLRKIWMNSATITHKIAPEM